MANKKTPDPISVKSFFDFCGLLMSKVGIGGFVVIAGTIYIFKFVPQDLKDQLTKTWLLFQGPESVKASIFIIFVLSIVLLAQQLFYSKAIKLKDIRIKEIAAEKTQLQEILLKKPLRSTKK